MPPTTAEERRDELKRVYQEARVCARCPQLAETRTQVVFGSGNADADLMFVGEAPGRDEDEQGLPFVGRSGKLLNQLLGEIGLAREDVFIANTLKCLRYNAQVQLGDGTWERIGRLVRTGYAGTVMSVGADGRLVPKRVPGWPAPPLAGRSVLRVTHATAKRAGAHQVCALMTADHPVLTERGFVPAGDLRADDRVATGQGLSDMAFDVACGSLLGDSSISAKSSCLTTSHSATQRDYALFKLRALEELDPSFAEFAVAAVSGGDAAYDVIQVRTSAQRALRTLRAAFYRERKIVPDWIAERLTPRMLAIWFMDDGYMRLRPGRRPLAEIATNGFSDGDRHVLVEALLRLGLPAKASRGRLYFDVLASEKLARTIAPFVPDSMRYKLGPTVAAEIPFEPGAFRWNAPRTMFDQVLVEEVSDPGNDTTYFCIDVEDTHNFVTSGGVVHNCRPPGNRDPHPAEIDNCQDYLLRQVALIEPIVICTLGNFSTKLLRGDPTGITRLHGREELLTIGSRTVRLYPLFHPAAALYTPSNVEVLRQDFARIPELLAAGPPPQPEGASEPEPAVPEPEVAEKPEDPDWAARDEPDSQLGLF